MSKAIEENKLTIMIKRLCQEYNSYWKFMCTDEIKDENKNNLTPVTVFVIAEKLLSLWH